MNILRKYSPGGSKYEKHLCFSIKYCLRASSRTSITFSDFAVSRFSWKKQKAEIFVKRTASIWSHFSRIRFFEKRFFGGSPYFKNSFPVIFSTPLVRFCYVGYFLGQNPGIFSTPPLRFCYFGYFLGQNVKKLRVKSLFFGPAGGIFLSFLYKNNGFLYKSMIFI